MPERIKQKVEKLEELYKKLYEQAEIDGKVTEDEEKILQNIKLGIDEFKKYADKALEDNLITVSEHTKMLQLQNKILRESERQAMEDDKISDDERDLLQHLIRSIRSL